MSTRQGIEVKKDGLAQLQDGSWVLKLKVHPNDMPTSLMTAAMGTRYMAALVEIGDDEQPVNGKQKQNLTDMKRSNAAFLLCGQKLFQQFLVEECGAHLDAKGSLTLEHQAATAVRTICNVNSRAQFDSNEQAAAKWDGLHERYQVWRQE